MSYWWSWGVLLLLVGCAHREPTASISGLVAEARANEIAGLAAHRGQSLRLPGVVRKVGIKRVEKLVGETTRDLRGSTTEISRVTTGYPYLYATDPRAGEHAGRLLCYFAPEQLDSLAKLKVGDQVVVGGEFQQYSDDATTIVLTACELE